MAESKVFGTSNGMHELRAQLRRVESVDFKPHELALIVRTFGSYLNRVCGVFEYSTRVMKPEVFGAIKGFASYVNSELGLIEKHEFDESGRLIGTSGHLQDLALRIDEIQAKLADQPSESFRKALDWIMQSPFGGAGVSIWKFSDLSERTECYKQCEALISRIADEFTL